MHRYRDELLHRLLKEPDKAEDLAATIKEADSWVYSHPEDWDVREEREKAAVRHKWLWHPVSRQQRKRLRREVKRFFDAYYKKLRAEVARREDPANPVPHYLKGYRNIRTYVCTDGVLIGHTKADKDAAEDSYVFTISDRTVKSLADYLYNRPLPGGEKLDPVIEYQDGEDYTFAYRAPRITATPMDETHVAGFESDWTRLDFASLNHLDTWRYESKARQEAKIVADHHLQ